MKTVSLTLSFFAIVTIGFAATGCAGEAPDSTTSRADDEASVEQPGADQATGSSDEYGVEETRRHDDVPMLAQDPGPHPGSPIARPRDGLPPNPNPCPGRLTPAPQLW